MGAAVVLGLAQVPAAVRRAAVDLSCAAQHNADDGTRTPETKVKALTAALFGTVATAMPPTIRAAPYPEARGVASACSAILQTPTSSAGWSPEQLAAVEAEARAVADALQARCAPLAPPTKRAALFALDRGPAAWVLKVAHPARAAQMQHERTWAQRAAGYGLAPAVVPLEGHAGALLTERVSGQPLSIDGAREPKVLQAAMALLARLHRVAPPRSGPSTQLGGKAEVRIDELEASGLAQAFASSALRRRSRALQGALDAAPVAHVLCHGDFWHGNLLRAHDGGLWLVDWSDAGYADPVVEVARYLTLIDFPLLEAHEPFQSYLGRTPRPDELRRLHTTMALLDVDYYALSVLRVGLVTHKPDVAAMAARIRAAALVLPDLPPLPAT